ncbi:MAG TPA: cupin domain-containing protein [Gaiellaceae bacterium]|nr:cupin domain-containing protein [Gaiellaceae bacterium]
MTGGRALGYDRAISELTPNLLDLDRFAVPVERVEKPWGHELVYAATEHYLGKVIFVRAGEQLSLQFHRHKDEVIYVHSGRVELEVGEPGRTPDVEVVGPGRAFRLRPGTVHRWRALEDTVVLEVSTPEADDVVRLEDRYGRADA